MQETYEVPVPPIPSVKGKRYAIWKAPAPEVMTLDEARTAGSKLVLEGKTGTMYILEIIEVIEPFTRVVAFPGK